MGALLIMVGSLVALVGHILLLIVAFRTSVLWGLGSLCIPLVGLIFIILHFDECKNALIAYVVGIALQVAGVVMGGSLPYNPMRGAQRVEIPVESPILA